MQIGSSEGVAWRKSLEVSYTNWINNILRILSQYMVASKIIAQ